MSEVSSRRWLLPLATTLTVALMLTLAAAAGWDNRREPALPSVLDKLHETHIDGQAKIKIGVSGNEPLLSEVRNGVRVGFDIEIARYIAGSLGFDTDQRIEWIPVATGNRVRALQSGTVDLVVSSFSMTEEREKLVRFAGPYLVTQQAVLVPNRLRDRIRTIEDLRSPDLKVCTSGGSTSEKELEKRQIQTNVAQTVGDCVRGVLAKRYDVVSSDETILAGYLSRYPTDFELVDMPFGTSELLGIGVPIGDPALRDLVAFFLQKSYLEGRNGASSAWLTAYNRTLGPWLRKDLYSSQPQPLNVPELVDFDDKAPR
ncbi:transporter substrate-binding domain-containing protein [Micromonospora sp. WMMD998]|uniref:transporter substrate-binding domain-containing protein n=1 Tax=Micromonospora sp. WMMD998 TaxID=3016092 RepID=UPI00249B5083|nr:transporter substrate-binding domain-containing protein [Micromonospora sp. WMMD998]WFE37254.1 transporter substrate-binding domain-containing protein [Micromonospora sp. WMMD998]